VTTVAADGTDIGTVATDIANVNIAAANIATIIQAAEAVASALAYTFDSTTTMADPGIGDIRLNNASLASVTAMAIDALTAQAGNPDLSDFIDTWDVSTNPTSKGYFRLTKGGAPENFAIYEVTNVVDNTGWLEITVSHTDSNGSFTAADDLFLTFTRTGDQGAILPSADNDFTGDNTFIGKTAFKDTGDLTISTAAITITGTSHVVLAETGTADTLSTINGGVNGEVVILRPDAGDTITIDEAGNIVTPDGSDVVLDGTAKVMIVQYDLALTKWIVLSAPAAGAGAGGITIGTKQATTSGTAFDFTGIPSGTKRITMVFDSVGLDGTDDFSVLIGDSGGLETSGYLTRSNSGSTVSTSASEFIITIANATATSDGRLVLELIDETNNTWIASGLHNMDTTEVCTTSGIKSLSAELDRVRLTRAGTDNFDVGSINITYE